MSRLRTFLVLWVFLTLFLFALVNWRTISEGRFRDVYSALFSGQAGLMIGSILGLIVAYVLPSAVVAGIASLAVRRSKAQQ